MAKSYSWLQDNPPEEDIAQRTIFEQEIIYVKNDIGEYEESKTEEKKFTLAQKKGAIANVDRQIANLEEQRKQKVAELNKVKEILGIE